MVVTVKATTSIAAKEIQHNDPWDAGERIGECRCDRSPRGPVPKRLPRHQEVPAGGLPATQAIARLP